MHAVTREHSLKEDAARLLESLGVARSAYSASGSDALQARSPIDGAVIGGVAQHRAADVANAVREAHDAFLAWRHVPAPRRGEFVRLLGEQLRRAKPQLGRLISIEVGKSLSEGLGEVQETIDICDYAVGLSRQLHGCTIASERPEHRMMETWHPLGACGVVTAFNFPLGVWSWNAALIFVCGNSMVWKPSEKTPLCSLAVQALTLRAMQEFGPDAPRGLSHLLIGGRELGEALVTDRRVPLVSATGSCAMGHHVAPLVSQRFARAILELGGNNAAIVSGSADLDLSLRSIAFAAMGTTGQRCTTLRRLIVHETVYDRLVPQLKHAFGSVAIGNPLEPRTLLGPLIDEQAYRGMVQALGEARATGGKVFGGERVLQQQWPNAFYVQPALVEMPAQTGPMLRETFAPILYVVRYRHFEEALELHNQTSAGLSSAIFTLNMREAERFLAVGGSDCGVANVNIGPSGAEIGGAFGGEKDSGSGREAGSDAWKGYMRRTTNTTNYGAGLPLAQGVTFEVGRIEDSRA
jgi:L-aminoadipate-semialdehyde dehydrogenase